MRLLRSITRHRRPAKIGDGAVRQKLTTEAFPAGSLQETARIKENASKNCFFVLHLGHRQRHKERILK
jgi:hypothetical protein